MALHSLETDPEYIALQTELVHLQTNMTDTSGRLLIIFEGRDTAGKGGGIMRFVRFLNPRHYRIVALTKPTEVEQGQWFLQRYIKHLPDPGEIVFFDRSWYNRAVVEPVMGFCNNEKHQEFMDYIVTLEETLVKDGIKVIKFWFSIDREEQKKRLKNRQTNPLHMWKMSTVDAVAQQKWEAYTKYKSKMFCTTATPSCPWVVIDGNRKGVARKAAMRYVISQVDYPDKGAATRDLEPDPAIVTVIRNAEEAERYLSLHPGH
ncbi:MAG: polyphosphate kinase 2 [Xanthomonadales bacterium]|nr:polyphosphate kinase 2 [Xanthomonadales bacterium]